MIESYALANDKNRVLRNLAHASDSVETAQREIKLWFTAKELHSYKKTLTNTYNIPSNLRRRDFLRTLEIELNSCILVMDRPMPPSRERGADRGEDVQKNKQPKGAYSRFSAHKGNCNSAQWLL